LPELRTRRQPVGSFSVRVTGDGLPGHTGHQFPAGTLADSAGQRNRWRSKPLHRVKNPDRWWTGFRQERLSNRDVHGPQPGRGRRMFGPPCAGSLNPPRYRPRPPQLSLPPDYLTIEDPGKTFAWTLGTPGLASVAGSLLESSRASVSRVHDRLFCRPIPPR